MTIRITHHVRLPARRHRGLHARRRPRPRRTSATRWRRSIKAQTADPATLSNPSTEPVTGVDPDYATTSSRRMRESVAEARKSQAADRDPGRRTEPGRHLTMNALGGRQARHRRGHGRDRPAGPACDGRTRARQRATPSSTSRDCRTRSTPRRWPPPRSSIETGSESQATRPRAASSTSTPRTIRN